MHISAIDIDIDIGVRYRFKMALHQLLSALGPAALRLIIIGVGPFQICNTLQNHVIGILSELVIVCRVKINLS